MSLDNAEGKCNNPNCPSPKIYWNKSVVHKETGRSLPLSEPFNPHVRPPNPHLCMKKYRPGIFLDKYAKEPPQPDWHKTVNFSSLPKWQQKAINKRLKKQKKTEESLTRSESDLFSFSQS